MCDNSIVWPGIKSLTHFSLWQLRRLYFPSHCGQEAVFIRASDAEIVSCLRSCQFQLGESNYRLYPDTDWWHSPRLLIGHLLQIQASHWLRSSPPCGRNLSLLHEYIITWRQTTRYYAVWPPRVRQSWWGLGNYFEPCSLQTMWTLSRENMLSWDLMMRLYRTDIAKKGYKWFSKW